MRKYLILLTSLGLALIGIVAWSILSDRATEKATLGTLVNAVQTAPLSLARLPALGYISLSPNDESALDDLGLGGVSPWREPPSYPFVASGLYWSEHFSLTEGDRLHVWVLSAQPISWFGVDWSLLPIRGVLASTELDEDGRSVNPLYPSRWSSRAAANGTLLSLEWDIAYDAECALVVKNSDPAQEQRISVVVEGSSPFNLKNVLRDVPLIGNLFEHDSAEPGFKDE